MTLNVNGTPRDLPVGATVADAVARLMPSHAAVAAELNKKLIPKRLHATTHLAEGDTLELVALVGGG
jgi:thiamine biosynthesis protein ThiS